MTWKDRINDNPLAWLLSSEDPGVSYLALRDLVLDPGAQPDPSLLAARQCAHRQGPIAAILEAMDPEGFWSKPGPGYGPKYRANVWSVIALAQLGAHISEDPRIELACNYLLDHALTPYGQFSTNGNPGNTIDCLQGNLCWALTDLGCTDPRLEGAFEWMARTVTGEGVAPFGDKSTPVRYYSGKCGPDFACGANNKQPCAWGAVKVLGAFGSLPESQRSPLIQAAIQRGVDFLLGTDPAGARYPTWNGAKPSGNWWKFGFPLFYITDLLQLVEVLVRLGRGDDPRLSNALEVILAKQDDQGRWPLEYSYSGKTWVDFGPKKQPNPYITWRALRGLYALPS
jgi:hypothetical protein